MHIEMRKELESLRTGLQTGSNIDVVYGNTVTFSS